MVWKLNILKRDRDGFPDSLQSIKILYLMGACDHPGSACTQNHHLKYHGLEALRFTMEWRATGPLLFLSSPAILYV